MIITKALQGAVNMDLLLEQIAAQFPSYVSRPYEIEIHNVQADDEPAIDAILAAHNAAILSTSQKLENAQTIALNQARDYLKRQLLNASPNISAIYSTIKAYVDNNPYLLQMVTNQIALMQLAYAWPPLGGLTNIDKARYIAAVKDVIALLA